MQHFKALLIMMMLFVSFPIFSTHSSMALTNTKQSSYVNAQTTTRRDAIISYIQALYSANEGAFYSSLSDWPTDPRIMSYHDVIDVYDPILTLSLLDATTAFDISNCSVFLKSLINPPSEVESLGPVNFSRITSFQVTISKAVVDAFELVGISENLDEDDFESFIRHSQRSSGGFSDNPWDTFLEEDIIATYSALYTLEYFDRLDAIDQSSALSYILSCYSNGGFSSIAGGEPTPDYVPLGLMGLEILGALDTIDRDEVISFELASWDNDTGSVYDGTIVDVERVVWSLSILNALDQIDVEATVSWVLSRQSSAYGEFLPFPYADLGDERLEWARAAVHILALLGRLDVLDQEFTVYMTPVHTIPQAYYDFISRHFPSTTTTTGSNGYIVWPRFDLSAFVGSLVPSFLIIVVLSPAMYWVCSERQEKKARLQERKKRKPGSKL